MKSKNTEKCEHCGDRIWIGSLEEFKLSEYKGILKQEMVHFTTLVECEHCETYKLAVVINEKLYGVSEYSQKGIYKYAPIYHNYLYMVNEGGLGVIFKYIQDNIYVFEEYYLDIASQAVTYYGIRFWIDDDDVNIKEDKWITSKQNVNKYKELLIKTKEIKRIFPEWDDKKG